MRDPAPAAVRLKDYAPPAFLVDSVALDVELFEDFARVRSRLAIRRRAGPAPLVLDGEELETESVALDGRALAAGEYALAAARLTIAGAPEQFTLETVCRIRPGQNTQLMGLYAAQSGFFTQAPTGIVFRCCSRTAIWLQAETKRTDATG
jgi:aminopeptidase N